MTAAYGGERGRETGAQPQTPVKGQLPLASPLFIVYYRETGSRWAKNLRKAG